MKFYLSSMYVESNDLWIIRYSNHLLSLIDGYVRRWPESVQKRVGDQLLRAAESIGANIVEGQGRFYKLDRCKFFYMSRGSLEETIDFIRRADQLKLLKPLETSGLLASYFKLSVSLNAFIRHNQKKPN